MAARPATTRCSMHLTFWPGSLVCSPAIVLGITRWREPGDPLSSAVGGDRLADVRDRADQAAALHAARLSRARRSCARCGSPMCRALAKSAAHCSCGLAGAVRARRHRARRLRRLGARAIRQRRHDRAVPRGRGLGIVVALAVLVPALKGRRLAAAGDGVPERRDPLLRAPDCSRSPELDQLWLSPAPRRLPSRVTRCPRRSARRHGRIRRAQHQLPFGHAHGAREQARAPALIAGKTGGLALVDSGESESSCS